MTYEEIIAKLKAAVPASTVHCFELDVEHEAEMLYPVLGRGRRRTRAVLQEIEAQARVYYADDITALLAEGGTSFMPPDPDKILTSRRYAIAWAVAELLRREGNV